MTDNISINSNIYNVDVTQQVNTVSIAAPGPQGPVGLADPTSSVAYATHSASSIFASSALFSNLSSSALFSSSATISASSHFSSSVINGLVQTSSVINSYINLSRTQPTQEGSIFYDATDHHSLSLISDTATPQELGQQVLARAVNGTADNTTLTKGTLVYISGATGNRVRIDRAIANDIGKHDVLGMVYDDIANNAEGFVLTFGVIDDIDTGGYTAGDTLYLSATSAGYYTNFPPTYPSYNYEIGVVSRANTNNGRILLKPNAAYNSNTASGNLLFSDGYRSIGSSSARIDYYGNASFTGNVNVTGLIKGLDGLTTTNSASIGQNLLITGLIKGLDGFINNNSASILSDLYVGGNIYGKAASATISSSAIVSSSANYAINAGNSLTTSQTNFNTLSVASAATVGGNLNVSGNLYVTGSTVSITASNLVLTDSLIYMAEGNASNINDIGIVGSFTPGASNTYQHTGLARDASDNTWKLFSGVISEPTNTIDFSSASWDNLKVGGLEVTNSVITGSIQYAENAVTASQGLYSFIVSASQGIITSGSVRYAASSNYSNYSGSAASAATIYSSNAIIGSNGAAVLGNNISLFASAQAPSVSSAAMLSIYQSSSINAGIVVRSASPSGVSTFELQNGQGIGTMSIDGLGRLWWDANQSGPTIRWGNQNLIQTAATPNTLLSLPYAATRYAMSFRGLSGQTADLIQFQNTNGSALAVFNSSAMLVLGSLGGSTTPLSSTGYNGSAYLTIYQNASANAGIIIKRNNSTSNANLIELLNESNAALIQMNSFGQINARNSGTSGTNTTLTVGQGSTTTWRNIALINFAGQSSAVFEIMGTAAGASPVFSISPLGQISSGSGFQAIATSSAMISVFNTFAAGQGIIIRGAPSQSANLQEWQSTTGASVAAIDSLGNITASGNVVYNQATNAQTSASYTLVLSDSGKFVERNSASLNFLTIPSNANAAFGIGARVDIIQTGSGTTILSASTGVTLNFYSPTSATTASFAGQWSGVTLIKRATDTWAAIGNIK